MAKSKDLVGKTYGRLTVTEKSGSVKGQVNWLCRCECGNTKIVPTASLNFGNTRSCGCIQKEIVAAMGKTHTTHGMTDTKLYSVWHGMRKRCICQTTKHYERYGGRGISICKEWDDFSNFYEWSIVNGYKEGLTIDRINNNGNYEPSNCRWATSKEQARNRCNTTMYDIDGVTKSLIEWSEINGVNHSTAYDRLALGYDPFKTIRVRGG